MVSTVIISEFDNIMDPEYIRIFTDNFIPLFNKKVNIIMDINIESSFEDNCIKMVSFDERGVRLTTVLFDQSYIRDLKLCDILDEKYESFFNEEVWIHNITLNDNEVRISCSIDSLKNHQK